MSKTVKWILIGLGSLVVLMIVAKIISGATSTKIKVSIEKAQKRTIVETVNASGKIYPEVEVKISSDIPGEITELYVAEGDTVKKGKVMARVKRDFLNTTITAPMDGIVTSMKVKKGEKVSGNSFSVGTEMMTVADMSVMEVRVDVGENDIVKLNMGDSVDVEVDAYNNRKFKGVVTQIASSIKSSSPMAAMTSDIANYEVRIRLDTSSYKDLIDPSNPGKFPFRPGMNASVDIKTKRHDNVLAVPIMSVNARVKGSDKSVADKKLEDEKKKKDENAADDTNISATDELEEVVFVLQENGTIKKLVVKSGIQDINYIEVLKGLNEGDEVVTGPYAAISKTLKDGMKVKVVPREKLFEK